MADPETVERQIQRNPAFRIPTRAEIIAQQIAEEDARAKKRNGFSSEAWVIRNDGSEYINTPDSGSVSYNTVSGPDWGGCGIDISTPDEQSWKNAQAFEQVFTQNDLSDWWDQSSAQDYNAYSYAYSQYNATGTFNLNDERTCYTIMNAKVVQDQDGNDSYIDTGAGCSMLGSGYGQALIDAQAKVLAQEVEEAAALKAENAKLAADDPLDIENPEVAARVQGAVVNPDYIDVDNMCVNPNSVEGQRIILAQAELNGDAPAMAAADKPEADAEAEAAPTTEASAPAQAGDVAAVYTATVDQQASPPAPTAPSDTVATPEQTPVNDEFERIKTKFELTPEQLKLKQAEPSPSAAPAAPQFEPAI